METKMQIESKILALSNDIADYPPTNLTMHEWQALIVLSSAVNSRERPILGIDDVKEIAKERGLTTKVQQNQLLNELINEQNRYEMTYDEFFEHYDGETPITRKTKKDILTAMETLGGKTVVTANDAEMFASFNWFSAIINDKKNKTIQYFLGQVSKALLMGLDKNFLQIMARLSIKEAKKYDIPIFLHMKSRLHNKKDSFSWTEELPDFQHRFGHDKVASYSSWKDYYRRVLLPAEAYGLKSGDVAYKFEGKAMKGRKVTHIKSTVWRIGNIHALNSRGGTQETLFAEERKKRWAGFEEKMTVQQMRGYEYLKTLDVNYGFLLDECMNHSCLRHEVVIGYEDLFLRLLWSRFNTYTKAQKKGGAFVTWWRRGRLTEGDHYWATIEAMTKRKLKISDEEKAARYESATMSWSAYNELQKATKDAPVEEAPAKKIVTKEKKKKKGDFVGVGDVLVKKAKKDVPSFDYATFKTKYPTEYRQIEEGIFEQVATMYGTAKSGSGDVDMTKAMDIEKQVKQMLPQRCETWYGKNVLNKL